MDKTLTLEEIKARMIAYLKDEDDFVKKQGHGLAFFCSRVNSYWNASATAKAKTKQVDHLKLVEESEAQQLQKIRDQIEALPNQERLQIYLRACEQIKRSPIRLDRIPGIDPKQAQAAAIDAAEIAIFQKEQRRKEA